MSEFGLQLFPWARVSAFLRCLVVLGWAALCPLLAMAHGALSGRIEQKLQECREQPENPEAHFKLAGLYVEHEEWEKAVTEIERVEQLAPGEYPTDYLRGCAFLLAQQPAEALVALDRFVTQHPTNPLGLLQRARARRELGKIEPSLQDFRAALQYSRSPEPDLILEAANAVAASGAKDEALAILQQGLAQLGAIPSLTLRALELEIVAGQYDAALARLDSFQKTAPRPEPWMARRAEILTQAGRIEEARSAWQMLITRLDGLPNLERGSHAMSMLAEKARLALKALPPVKTVSSAAIGMGNANYDEELDRADAEIARHPAEARCYFRRAEFNRLAQRWTRARADCDETDRLALGKFATDRVRGEVLAGEGKFAEALTVLNRYLARQPEDGLALAARARVELSLRQPDAALLDFQRSLTVTPDAAPDLFQEIATAFRSAGQDGVAAEVLAAGLAKHPGAPALVMQDIELAVARGQIEAALARIEEMSAGSSRPELWLARRARLLGVAGRHAEARATWQVLVNRIAARPNLERGAADLTALVAEARTALVVPSAVSTPSALSPALAHTQLVSHVSSP